MIQHLLKIKTSKFKRWPWLSWIYPYFSVATKIDQISSHYEFVWGGKHDGQLWRRALPCFCSTCRTGWNNPCNNIEQTGKWVKLNQKLTGTRIIKKYVSKSKK